ncbi:FGGY-family carbohydrate kinase [Vagococcus elongatus]|uniref:ATP:glycerol 3-phosphotransferase n=1 Tax=Vagococcus elongatus TaxID=180344 RepID=A0A430B430_9ENTE|nr:glycerol kinase GlpK [Vagococcus elongatus]RSU15116.1 hypothetical protein CBF29_01940 [Vagococcus elongatus]
MVIAKVKKKLVIDQSTSGTKLLLVEISGDIRIIDRLDLPHKQIFPQQGWVEHDPKEIMSNVYLLLEQMLTKHTLLAADIESLSITNQRETIVCWDKLTGEPIYNAIVWQCNRSVSLCNQLIDAGLENLIQKKTGLKIDSYFSGSKVKWLMNSIPEMKKKVQQNRLAVGTMDSWLIWNLSNRQVFATEPSNASRTLFYNIYEMQWDQELCEIFDVPITCLPEVRNSSDNFGNYQGISVTGIMADSQSALYGQKCIHPGDTKATLGTGCSVMMQLGEDIKIQNDKVLTTIAWSEAGQTNYALEGIIRSFGDTLVWLRDSLGLIVDIEEAALEAFLQADSKGVYFIPAQLGLGAPFWQPEARARFVGMNRSTTKIDLIRASFDSMAFQIKAVIDEMELASGIKIAKIRVDGGATKNQELMQLLADLTQKSVVIGQAEELSALGVIRLVLTREGYRLSETLTNEREIKPTSSRYGGYYLKWKQLIESELI